LEGFVNTIQIADTLLGVIELSIIPIPPKVEKICPGIKIMKTIQYPSPSGVDHKWGIIL
jgi:hypothetical protein